MSDSQDPLLRALGELEGEDQRTHPAGWEDALVGRRPAPDVAATAERGDAEEHALLVSLFTGPIAQVEVDGLVDRTLASWGRDQAAAPLAVVVVPLLRRRSTWTIVAVALAIAAAVVLWVPGRPEPGGELVAYNVVVRSQGVLASRTGDPPPAVARYQPDSTIDLVIAPERSVTDEIDLRVLARDHDGHEELLTPISERSPDGVMRIRGRLGDVLPLAPGRWRLRFILSHPGIAPTQAASVATALADGISVSTKPLDLDVVAHAE